MLWIFLAILAPFIWAISNLVDGDLMLHRLRKPWVILSVIGLSSVLPAAYIFVSGSFTMPSWPVFVFGLAVGVVSLLAYYPYFRALESAHPASATILWNLSPVLVTVFAFGLLGERLSAAKYVAIALLVLSAVVVEGVSWKSKLTKEEKRAALWMIVASCMTATQRLAEKALYNQTSTATVIALISVGSFLAGLCLLILPAQRKNLKLAFAKSGFILVTNQILDVAATVMMSLAISLGSVSVVVALGGLQALFILGLAWIAARIFTKKQFRIAAAPPVSRIIIAVALTVVGLMMIG